MLSKYNVFLLFFFLFNVYFLFDLNGDWTQFIDSEIIWPYNSLLILSGYKIEFIEFGTIYYILLSIFQKLINFLNLSEISNLDSITKSKNFSHSMQELIFITRLLTIILGFIFLITLKKIIFKILKNENISLILTILFFYSPGFIVSMSHSRADFISTLFIIFFLYNLICFVEKKNENFINLFFVFLFFNFAILTKIQVYFYFPWLFLIGLFFCKIKSVEIKNTFFENRLFYLFVLGLILLSLIYPLINLRYTKLSIIFLYYQLISFNIIFYLYIKYFNYNFTVNKCISSILKYNFFLIIVYIGCYILFSNLPFLKDTLVVKLTYLDPSSILQFSESDVLHKKNIALSSSNIFLIVNEVLSNFFKIIDFYFLSLNFQCILIYLILIIYIYTFNKQPTYSKISTPIIFLVFFMINFINSMRVNDVYYLYFIFSDFILFILLAYNLNFVNFKKLLLTSVFSFLMITFFTFNLLNIEMHRYGYHNFSKKNKLEYWCNQNYVENFAKKISVIFYDHCNQNLN